MSDVALILTDNCFDIEVEDGDLVEDEGLETAIAISLFSDKRVTDEELPTLETVKRGWWGDVFSKVDQDQIGSRLWTIDRSKIITETLRRSEEFCLESLEWMKIDGIANEIAAESEYNQNKQMITTIQISRPDEQREIFSVLWDKQSVRRI